MKRLVAAAIAAAAVSLGTAAPAAADELTYLQQLNAYGISVYNTSMALNTGWAICNALNTNSGAQVAVNLYRITPWSDVPTPAVAAMWVVAAADNLCPWAYNSGQLV